MNKLLSIFLSILLLIIFSLLLISLTKCEGDTNLSQKGEECLNVISDDYLKKDLKYALSEIKVDINNIEEIKLSGNWVGGEIYDIKYYYKEENARITLSAYTNLNSTIASINYGYSTDQKIYDRGYEPYEISNFYFDIDYKYKLKDISKEYLSSQLYYPSTVKWKDFGYQKDFELYYVGVEFTAKNSFNMEITNTAVFAYVTKNEGKSFWMVAYKLNGKIQFNNVEPYLKKESDRQKKEPKYPGINLSDKNDNSIVLEYGILGKYGVENTLDNINVIEYKVPYGKYRVKNLSLRSVVFVANDTYYKNSNGYYENSILSSIQLTKKNEEAVIEVKEGYHIEISQYSIVELICEENN